MIVRDLTDCQRVGSLSVPRDALGRHELRRRCCGVLLWARCRRSTPTTRPKCTSAALIYSLFIVVFVAAIRLRLIAMVEKGQRRNCKDQKIARCDRAPIEARLSAGLFSTYLKLTAVSVALKAAVLPVWYDLEALLVWFGRCLTDLPIFDQRLGWLKG